MYSGTTVGKRSGHWIGAHQRIDRIARRHVLEHLPPSVVFPSSRDILHFEGNNGPDGIKRKSPSVDEPWHYIDPTKPADRALIDMILDHQVNLRAALRSGNEERAAFEAAWMAHAIVDGLTPAHHDPYGEQIEELFGISLDERVTVKDKNIVKGHNRRDTLSRNWAYWGTKGLLMTHFWFEMGVATSILGTRYKRGIVTIEDVAALKKDGYEKVFREILGEVASLEAYRRYKKGGWTPSLAKTVQRTLIPLIIKAVTLGWIAALPTERIR
jgi:hypothetical protein